MRPDVRRSIVSAHLLTRLAAERGLGLDACLHGTGIDAAQLGDPAAEITGAQELQLIRNLVAALGHMPGLGLDAGLRYHLSSYGIWGYTLLSSPTFRSAAELAVRYLDLSYAFGRYRLERRGEDLLIVLDDSELPDDLRQFLVERDFAAWANAAWEMRPGGFPAKAAQFRFPRPSYAWRLDKLCGVRPTFDAPLNAVLLPAKDLDAPLPQANPTMARLCEEQCRQLLAKRQVRSGISGQIRDRLLRNPADMPSLDDVAAELHVSVRSLRRRLDEENTSFRALLDEVRQTLAEEMLTAGHMKLAEIAARLGYTEPAAFIAAFKRWKGQSPTAYRESRRQLR
ncbi:AraC family transcriptional regulator [Fontimonas sp. SYSU GA230001]|uniref:AraC family transcriptional regulator n=1 Tax=Fontimonas sp. SYSU GA230001 TaxID=3142450 RepID=UPI0032B3450E